MQTVIQRRSLSNIVQLTLTLLLCMLLFYGCPRRSKYVYVETSILTDKFPYPKREITETNQFKSIAPKITKVAFRAPDYCYSQAASISDKHAEAAKNFIRSECGVEMGTLESKLAEEGYTVYSWKAVDNIMKSQGKSMLLAAQELGAEVLFTVNSLEGIYASSDDMIKRSFFWSDREGSKGAPSNLDEGHRSAIRQVAKHFEKILFDTSFGAFLDVTAVDVATGQAIWFYKSGIYDLKRAETSVNLVVAGRGNWKVYMVDGVSVRQITSASSEIDSTRKPDRFRNTDNYYDKYVKDIIADFVKTFKASRKSGIGVNR